MNLIASTCQRIVSVFTPLLFLLAMASCEGTETRDNMDNSVEILSGKEQIEQMNKMKTDIDKIKEMQARRLKQPE